MIDAFTNYFIQPSKTVIYWISLSPNLLIDAKTSIVFLYWHSFIHDIVLYNLSDSRTRQRPRQIAGCGSFYRWSCALPCDQVTFHPLSYGIHEWLLVTDKSDKQYTWCKVFTTAHKRCFHHIAIVLGLPMLELNKKR